VNWIFITRNNPYNVKVQISEYFFCASLSRPFFKVQRVS